MSFETRKKDKPTVKSKLLIGILTSGILIACGSSDGNEGSPYTELFEPSSDSTATPNVLTGLWGKSKVDTEHDAVIDTRAEFGEDTVTLSGRCTFGDGTVIFTGVDVPARTTDSTITILEAKKDTQSENSLTCSVHVIVGETPYVINGLNLTAYDSVWVKIRD